MFIYCVNLDSNNSTFKKNVMRDSSKYVLKTVDCIKESQVNVKYDNSIM